MAELSLCHPSHGHGCHLSEAPLSLVHNRIPPGMILLDWIFSPLELCCCPVLRVYSFVSSLRSQSTLWRERYLLLEQNFLATDSDRICFQMAVFHCSYWEEWFSLNPQSSVAVTAKHSFFLPPISSYVIYFMFVLTGMEYRALP